MGALDGVREGECEGECDGVREGATDGVREGVREGAREGVRMGALEGVSLGLRDGFWDGAREGFWEGVRDGLNEGDAVGGVGAFEGAPDGLSVVHAKFCHEHSALSHAGRHGGGSSCWNGEHPGEQSSCCVNVCIWAREEEHSASMT